MTQLIRQGTIVYVDNVPDEFKRNPKPRNLIVLTPTDYIESSEFVVCVAVTTKDYSVPEGLGVKVPHQNPGISQCSTGLTEPSVAHCGWRPKIKLSDVVKIKGRCPVSSLHSILAIVDVELKSNPHCS